MSELSSLGSQDAEAERGRLVTRHGSYHRGGGHSKVWHTVPGCPMGKRIAVQNLRGGHGDKEKLCDFCDLGFGKDH